MTEVLTQITTEAQQFLDGDRTDVSRTIQRRASVDYDGADIDINQTKLISSEEIGLVRAKGALALATTVWFNEVDWLKKIGSDESGWHNLRLNATYPLEYFEDRPVVGLFVERESEKRWLDQYGAIDGFGNGGEISLYVPRFVAPGSRVVTELRYPDDPTALDTYNARYRLYMDDLDAADPTVTYYRGWSHAFSQDRTEPPQVIGGLSLAGISIEEVVRQGSTGMEEGVARTRLVLTDSSEQNGYVGRDITIAVSEAITEPYWDGEADREPASEELLATTLELILDRTMRRP